MFHARALLEFQALQSIFLDRSRDASRRPLPSCPSPDPCGPPDDCPRTCRSYGLPAAHGRCRVASRLCSPVRVRRDIRPSLESRSARGSPGLRAPSRHSLTDPAPTCLHAAPPSSFRSAPLPPPLAEANRYGATLPRLPGVFTRSGLVVFSSTRQAFLGFPTSSTIFAIREPPRPGSWFHLGCRTTSPLCAQSLFGRFRLPAGARKIVRVGGSS